MTTLPPTNTINSYHEARLTCDYCGEREPNFFGYDATYLPDNFQHEVLELDDVFVHGSLMQLGFCTMACVRNYGSVVARRIDMGRRHVTVYQRRDGYLFFDRQRRGDQNTNTST